VSSEAIGFNFIVINLAVAQPYLEAPRPVVHIETVDLTVRGLTLPSDRVGMVIAQPHVSLTADEPFQCAPATRVQQLALIARTLDIARAAPHGAPRTHFTIFPEFCIPGLDGVALVEAALRAPNWPAGTIVIGGVDGLLRPDYLTLIGAPDTFVHTASNGAACVAGDQWVNCVVTWIKGADNRVERWIQPKLHPSRPENNAQYQRMFQGGCIYLFKGLYEAGGASYRFSSLVCFDWIATIGASKPWQWLLSAIHNEAAPMLATMPLTWLFVVQHNPHPNHAAFLGELPDFYNPNQFPSASRQGACVIFTNNAGRDAPGRADTFGCTSLIFSQNASFTPTDCYVTYSNGGVPFRGNNLVWPQRDVFFRERGPCIHSFIQVNPTFIIPGAAGQSIPVESPFVYSIDAAASDPRTPGAVVPGAVKWLNDTLDGIECLSVAFPARSLSQAVAASHGLNLRDLRTKDAAPAAKVLALSDPTFTKERPGQEPLIVQKNADEWGPTENEALAHVVHTLDIFRVGFADTSSNTTSAHAEVTIRGKSIDLIAVRGATHELGLKHADKQVPRLRRPLLVVSRDKHNSALNSREGTIFRTGQNDLQSKRRFTDPGNNRFYLSFQELLQQFLASNTQADLEGGVYGQLAN
jgi:hypothetical protein